MVAGRMKRYPNKIPPPKASEAKGIIKKYSLSRCFFLKAAAQIEIKPKTIKGKAKTQPPTRAILALTKKPSSGVMKNNDSLFKGLTNIFKIESEPK
jgi:hypothetical protein